MSAFTKTTDLAFPTRFLTLPPMTLDFVTTFVMQPLTYLCAVLFGKKKTYHQCPEKEENGVENTRGVTCRSKLY